MDLLEGIEALIKNKKQEKRDESRNEGEQQEEEEEDEWMDSLETISLETDKRPTSEAEPLMTTSEGVFNTQTKDVHQPLTELTLNESVDPPPAETQQQQDLDGSRKKEKRKKICISS